MLVLAISTITLALVFYTIGVWAEHVQRILRWWHAAFFALGLAADTTGTLLMTRIAEERRSIGVTTNALDTVMEITGVAAIILMALHLLWAIVVLIRNRETEKASFHRLSIAVWAIWLVPYIAGALGAMIGTAR